MGEKSDHFLRVSAATDLHEGPRVTTEEISTNSTTRAQSSIIWYIKAALIDSRCSEMIYLVTCSGLPHFFQGLMQESERRFTGITNHQHGCSLTKNHNYCICKLQKPTFRIIVQFMGSWYVSRHGIGSTGGKW